MAKFEILNEGVILSTANKKGIPCVPYKNNNQYCPTYNEVTSSKYFTDKLKYHLVVEKPAGFGSYKNNELVWNVGFDNMLQKRTVEYKEEHTDGNVVGAKGGDSCGHVKVTKIEYFDGVKNSESVILDKLICHYFDENKTESPRSQVKSEPYPKEDGSTGSVSCTLRQEKGVITTNYGITLSPQSSNLTAAGGNVNYTVNATKTVTINGTPTITYPNVTISSTGGTLTSSSVSGNNGLFTLRVDKNSSNITVTATNSEDTSKKASATVTVEAKKVTKVEPIGNGSLSYTTVPGNGGSATPSVTYRFKVYYSDDTTKEVTSGASINYSGSINYGGSIGSNGTITGVQGNTTESTRSVGSVTATITYSEGTEHASVTPSCQVQQAAGSVSESYSISITPTSKSLSASGGEVTFTVESKKIKTINGSSSEEYVIATITSTGGRLNKTTTDSSDKTFKLTVDAGGSQSITVTANNGHKTASATVTTAGKEIDPTKSKCNSISLSYNDIPKNGGTVSPTPSYSFTIVYTDGTKEENITTGATLTYESSYAGIDSDGKVTKSSANESTSRIKVCDVILKATYKGIEGTTSKDVYQAAGNAPVINYKYTIDGPTTSPINVRGTVPQSVQDNCTISGGTITWTDVSNKSSKSEAESALLLLLTPISVSAKLGYTLNKQPSRSTDVISKQVTWSNTPDSNNVYHGIFTPNFYDWTGVIVSNSITINWDPQGGTFAWNNSQSVLLTKENEGNEIQPIETKNGYSAGWGVNKDGYTFKGWSINPEASEPDGSLGIADKEKTFYAVYSLTEYNYIGKSGKPTVLFDKESTEKSLPTWYPASKIPINITFEPNPYTLEDTVTCICTPTEHDAIIQDQRSGESYALPDMAGTSITREQKGSSEIYLGYFYLYNGNINTGSPHIVKTKDELIYTGNTTYTDLIIKDGLKMKSRDNGDGTTTICFYIKSGGDPTLLNKVSNLRTSIINGSLSYNTSGYEELEIPEGYLKTHVNGGTFYTEFTMSNQKNGTDSFLIIDI